MSLVTPIGVLKMKFASLPEIICTMGVAAFAAAVATPSLKKYASRSLPELLILFAVSKITLFGIRASDPRAQVHFPLVAVRNICGRHVSSVAPEARADGTFLFRSIPKHVHLPGVHRTILTALDKYSQSSHATPQTHACAVVR